ncbi:hypothetical protein BSKO_12532 [Bryopsis sp. KO-2023]|nr:hypothetical protein BSKO_12532 [Bryopsis sp. KO-2023]
MLRAVGMGDLAVDAKNLGVSFTPIHEDFGADVSVMDLDGGISEAQGALVNNALDRFLLLRFRRQTPEPADEAKEKGTGVKSLLATPFTMHSFEGMSGEETHKLLEEFLGPQGATAPERVWIDDWQPGDVIVWKNRQLIHSSPAPGSYDEPRLNHLAFWESNEPVSPVQDVAA